MSGSTNPLTAHFTMSEQAVRSFLERKTSLCISYLQILDIAKRHGLESVDQQVGVLISEALETHLGALIKQIFAMARQRTDTDRTRPGMVLTGNVRKKLHEINARNSEKQREQDLEAAEIQQVSLLLKGLRSSENCRSADLTLPKRTYFTERLCNIKRGSVLGS